ncbi:MAG: hypothetical protein ACR2HJ_00560 [Fimbriimonadales bacterium]
MYAVGIIFKWLIGPFNGKAKKVGQFGCHPFPAVPRSALTESEAMENIKDAIRGYLRVAHALHGSEEGVLERLVEVPGDIA